MSTHTSHFLKKVLESIIKSRGSQFLVVPSGPSLPRGKSFFVKKTYGQQAYEDYAPEQLLQMGKAQMGRVLLAYEGDLPGSAAEKLRVNRISNIYFFYYFKSIFL